jgi:uncharacterized lipoprotein YajG
LGIESLIKTKIKEEDMTMKTKIIIATGLFALTLLAGCEKSGEEAKAPEAAPAASAAPEAAPVAVPADAAPAPTTTPATN